MIAGACIEVARELYQEIEGVIFERKNLLFGCDGVYLESIGDIFL